MKTLNLTDDQYDILVDLAIEERNAIRFVIKEEEEDFFANEDGIKEQIERFNELADVFDLEKWDE